MRCMSLPLPKGWKVSHTMKAVLFALTLCMGLSAAAEPAAGGAGGQTVLETGSYWRHFIAWKSELVRAKSGELKVLDAKPGKDIPVVVSPNPPADWASPEFDDDCWAREPGPIPASSSRMSLLCLRGKFGVEDPARAGDLRLSLEFIGGAVVYLNGKEIARKNLPAGRLEFDTPAEDYPEEAYLTPDGFLYMNAYGDPGTFAERLRSRVREMRDVALPAAALRKGVNVLAVEIHRAPASDLLLTRKMRVPTEGWRGRTAFWWSRLGFRSLQLVSPAGGDAVRANVSRPAGLQVWNHSVLQRVHVTDYGDPNEPLRPVALFGPRNSVLAGQVVIGSDAPIKGLKASAGELRAVKGDANLAASCLEVHYLLPDGPRQDRNKPAGFETLASSAPAEVAPVKGGGAVQPLWISVRVPRDAAVGEYAGTLTVANEGNGAVEIPLRVKVHPWTMPDSREFASHVGLIQSPDSVALQYGVAMWSDRHWKLLEKSLELMGQLGCDYVWIPLMRRTHFGNQHGMVRWIKQPDGGFRHDFSIAEKYLDLAVKHLGRPEVVGLYVWEAFTGSPNFGPLGQNPSGFPFTVLDPATGRLSEEIGPKYGTPEAVAFLKPVVDGMREILRKRGLEKSMMFGVSTDAQPTKAVVEDLKTVAADMPWISRGHVCPRELYKVPVGYVCAVWSEPSAPDPAQKRLYGWQNPWLRANFPRAGCETAGPMYPSAPLALWRTSLECMLTAGIRGFGSMGADFWDVLGKKDQRNSYGGGIYNIIGRYPESAYGQVYMGNSSPSVLTPGPEGALPTVRFEMIRAAAQLAEARVFIERVLTDPVRKANLGGDLADRAQRLLDDRIRALRFARPYDWPWFVGSGWQARDDALYALAAEVAKATEEK